MINRRNLFAKFRQREPAFITPPYFSGEFDCIDCPAPCVQSCHRELLEIDNDRVKFNPNKLGCNFCKECAIACESIGKSVINLKYPASIDAVVQINTATCLAWNEVICYNCLDVCKFRAIEYLGMFRPTVNSRCVGCSECVSVCVNNSVIIRGN